MKQFVTNILIKHRETLAYLVAGSLTVLLNITSYIVFLYLLGGREPDMIHIMTANTIAFFIAVTFAYFANTLFVFRQSLSWSTLLQFFSMRIGTLVADNGGMWLLLMFMSSDILAKVIVNAVLIVLNYIIIKFVIFKERVNDK